MDPYLENPVVWPDFHQWYNTGIAMSLNRLLPAGYVAALDRSVWLSRDDEPDVMRVIRPDVTVTYGEPYDRKLQGSGSGLLLADAPTLVSKLPKSDVKKRSFVKITTIDGRLLTVLELLSPSNKKSGLDREQYLAKHDSYLGSNVNLVEIDLLRSGERLPTGRPVPPTTDYYVQIRDGQRRNESAIWAFGVRDRLPTIPVPITAGVDSVVLSLRTVLDRVYEDGRFRDKLHYDRPADPPLRREDAEWVTTLLTPKTPRPAKPKKG